ncbi:MAG: NAD-dependent epimerase/dehydratase family protein [Faecalibacterium sp.]
MAILVSGGAGYIGSHTCIELLNAGYDVVVADNYYNASPVVLDRVKQITGKDFRFYQADMTKHEDVERSSPSVPTSRRSSSSQPIRPWARACPSPSNTTTTTSTARWLILDVMRRHNCHNFVFSSPPPSTATPPACRITEDFPVGATTNPYGTTKAMTERILTDVCKADPTLNVALLRYFNPIGAHKSGLIGEDPNGIPNNLMPYIAKVAVGKLEKVHVFGNDYPTPDGTGVRDYIHVVDLARGHVCAIKKLETNCGLFICNLGTGKGYSVLDVIHAFEKACGKTHPLRASRPAAPATSPSATPTPPRPRTSLAGWPSTASRRCAPTSWNWQKKNPDGYHTAN